VRVKGPVLVSDMATPRYFWHLAGVPGAPSTLPAFLPVGMPPHQGTPRRFAPWVVCVSECNARARNTQVQLNPCADGCAREIMRHAFLVVCRCTPSAHTTIPFPTCNAFVLQGKGSSFHFATEWPLAAWLAASAVPARRAEAKCGYEGGYEGGRGGLRGGGWERAQELHSTPLLPQLEPPRRPCQRATSSRPPRGDSRQE